MTWSFPMNTLGLGIRRQRPSAMRAIQSPEINPSSPAAPIRTARLRNPGRALRPIASAGIRGGVLIAVALLLILIILPAALGAAGT